MRGIQWMSVLLIFKTQILAAHKMCFGLLGSIHFLDECHICNVTWQRDNKKADKYIGLDKKGAGFYECGNTVYYLLAVGKNLTLHFYPRDVKYAFVGKNVTLEASVEFATWNDKIYLDYTFNNSKNNFEENRHETFQNMTYNKNVQSVMIFDNISQVTFYCSLEIRATKAHITVGVTQTKEISLRVYMLPSDVKPSKLRVRKAEYIKCHATSDPPVFEYVWNCQFEIIQLFGWERYNVTYWETSNDTIRFFFPGSFNCSCIARININGNIHISSWNGLLTIGQSHYFVSNQYS